MKDLIEEKEKRKTIFAGEVEKLRPYLETGDEPTTLSFGGPLDDPIDFLKSASGDGQGVEILVDAGHLDRGIGAIELTSVPPISLLSINGR